MLQEDPAGAAPEQVVVFETVGSVDDFRTAVRHTPGMEWLADWEEDEIAPEEDSFIPEKEGGKLSGRMYLVASNQEAVEQLLSLWARYERDKDVKYERGLAGWSSLFRHLRVVRRWDVQDRLEETGVLKDWQNRIDRHNERIRFEAELWCRQKPEEQHGAFDAFSRLVAAEGGVCVAQFCLPEIAYHGVLVDAPATTIAPILTIRETRLVKAEQVMFFRPLGQSVFPAPGESREITTLPPSENPLPTGDPTVALLDGVPLENHRLLAGRLIIDDPDGWASAYQAGERIHGTAMASLILHGELDATTQPLPRPLYVRPLMMPDPRDSNPLRQEYVPEDTLPIDLTYRAIRRMMEGDGQEQASAPSVRIVNFSIGDPAQPFNRFVSPWARLFDWLAFKYNLLFIVSAGNDLENIELAVPRASFSALSSEQLQTETLRALQGNERNRRILAPADSINAITVGAVQADRSTATPRATYFDPYVEVLLPSPYTRVGPGFRGAVKPDLLAWGGRQFVSEKLGTTHAYSTLTKKRNFSRPGQMVACPGRAPGDLSACHHLQGTSNATALATRAAALLYDNLVTLGEEPGGDLLERKYHTVLLKAMLVHGAQWNSSAEVLAKAFDGIIDRTVMRGYLERYMGFGELLFSRVMSSNDQRATIVGCGNLSDGQADIFRIPLPPSLSAQRTLRTLTVTLAWNSPVYSRNRKYRSAHLWFQLKEDLLGLSTRGARRRPAGGKGTVQHTVLEGESATAFIDGDAMELQVNCRAEAETRTGPIPYGISVTLEVGEAVDIPIYEEIRTRLRVPVSITPKT